MRARSGSGWGEEIGALQRAAARFNARGPPQQLKPRIATHRQVLRLDREHGTDIGEIDDLEQARFATPDRLAGFG
jgi:hypothetical protein